MTLAQSDLTAALRIAVSFFPEPFRAEYARLFASEHLETLAGRLVLFHTSGVPVNRLPPYFDEETTPPLGPVYAPFETVLRQFLVEAADSSPELHHGLAQAMLSVGCSGLLLLLGQRRTPASLDDARAIPPLRADLLAAGEQLHTPTDPLTVAARALAKHAARHPDPWWGKVTGTVPQKNAAARSILERLLEEPTWWNCFGHYMHEVVYEVRVHTGHGARWALDQMALIGFLEPFVKGHA
jgi:hypothetical protein